jgi:hypothetical protein
MGIPAAASISTMRDSSASPDPAARDAAGAGEEVAEEEVEEVEEEADVCGDGEAGGCKGGGASEHSAATA